MFTNQLAYYKRVNDDNKKLTRSFFNARIGTKLLLYVQYQRFGYLGNNDLRNYLDRLEIKYYDEEFTYNTYIRGKATRTFVKLKLLQRDERLRIIYIDLYRPIKDENTRRSFYKTGELYYLVLVDNYTRYTQLYILTSKESIPILRYI